MPHRVCPWWLGYFLISPLRRIGQQPRNILLPYVDEGHTVLEPGAGMGFFTLELARLVGPSGRVIALDVQPKMLKALKRRARKAGLLDRIDARLVAPNSLGARDLSGSVDFTLASRWSMNCRTHRSSSTKQLWHPSQVGCFFWQNRRAMSKKWTLPTSCKLRPTLALICKATPPSSAVTPQFLGRNE